MWNYYTFSHIALLNIINITHLMPTRRHDVLFYIALCVAMVYMSTPCRICIKHYILSSTMPHVKCIGNIWWRQMLSVRLHIQQKCKMWSWWNKWNHVFIKFLRSNLGDIVTTDIFNFKSGWYLCWWNKTNHPYTFPVKLLSVTTSKWKCHTCLFSKLFLSQKHLHKHL